MLEDNATIRSPGNLRSIDELTFDSLTVYRTSSIPKLISMEDDGAELLDIIMNKIINDKVNRIDKEYAEGRLALSL